MKNKISINIFGTDFYITSNESPDYVRTLGREIDSAVKNIVDASSASLPEALLLVCLSYLDASKKSTESSDNLREQVTEYLEEAAQAKLELARAKTEIDQLKNNKGQNNQNQNNKHRNNNKR